ncbi:hypothetical protein HDU98_009048, partial [Podochytrium sp. JEL0797]
MLESPSRRLEGMAQDISPAPRHHMIKFKEDVEVEVEAVREVVPVSLPIAQVNEDFHCTDLRHSTKATELNSDPSITTSTSINTSDRYGDSDSDSDSEEDNLYIAPGLARVDVENSPPVKPRESMASVASSKNSFAETTLAVLLHGLRTFKTKIYESEHYRIYRATVDSSRNILMAVAFLQSCVFASIFYVVLCVLSTTLPSIRFYNLIHAVIAFQGKVLLGLGWELAHLVKKGFAALEMQNDKKGVPLTKITSVDPDSCRSIIRMFLSILVMIEMSLWTLSFYMDWSPLSTYLGDFSCTPILFDEPFEFSTNDLLTWVDANTEFSTVQVYGLTMVNGIVGGSSATPNYSPALKYQIEGPGVVYMIETNCANATVSSAPNTTVTTSEIISQAFLEQIYTVALRITFPAGSHSWTEYSQQDLTQDCSVSVVSGDGLIQVDYVEDVWQASTARGISGEHIDRCVHMIDNPLRTMYYMREARLIEPIRGNDIGQISLDQHLSK